MLVRDIPVAVIAIVLGAAIWVAMPLDMFRHVPPWLITAFVLGTTSICVWLATVIWNWIRRRWRAP
jgi:hypothetical protein